MNATKEIVAVDLFCGAGGLTYGLEAAGIDVRLGVDIDPACKHPIEKNTNACFLESDIASLDPEVLAGVLRKGKVSLLAGCAPCQPFSTYARGAKRIGSQRRGRGKSGDWKLVERFGELVSEVRPDLVTMENVPPLAQQPVFKRLLAKLSDYSVDWGIVECRAIGLPQTRKRLVLVASRLGPIWMPEFDCERSTVRATIGDLPKIAAGSEDSTDRLHRSSKLSQINLARIRASVPGGTWRDWPRNLRATCHERVTGATYPSVYGRMEWDEPAPTITTQCFGYGNGRFGHPEQDRAISLREAAMLQGFPRTYSFIPDEEKVSFAKLGRLIGNAVPVNLAESIGRIIVEHVEEM